MHTDATTDTVNTAGLPVVATLTAPSDAELPAVLKLAEVTVAGLIGSE